MDHSWRTAALWGGGGIILLICGIVLFGWMPSLSTPTPSGTAEATNSLPPDSSPTMRPTSEVVALTPTGTIRQPTPQPATPDQRADEGVAIRADGTLLVDGQPFFPFGFALYPRYRTDEFTPETLEAIAAGGFNTLHAPIRDNYPDLLADAHRLNIRLLAEIYPYELDDAGIVTAISSVKDLPGLLAYAIADDVDDGGYYTPQLVARINQLVKQVDDQHPTYISGYIPAQISRFMETADIVAMQSYPIGKTNEDLARLSHVNSALSEAVAAGKPFNRPIIANLQAFTWPEQREPTAIEIRNMTYQALLNNVRGIIYYAYNDGVWQIERHPQVLQAVQSLAPEIERLAPALLDGVYTPLHSDNQDVLAAQWIHDNSRYIIVVNTAALASAVAIAIPELAHGQAEPLFAERPAGMVIENGQLSGNLDALAVHVYVLN